MADAGVDKNSDGPLLKLLLIGVEEAQAGIKTAGRNSNKLRYADDTTLMAESEEELKEPLDESERGDWKNWLKAQHSEN